MKIRVVAELMTRLLHLVPAQFLRGRDIAVEEESRLEPGVIELRNGDVELRLQPVVVAEHEGCGLALRPGNLRVGRKGAAANQGDENPLAHDQSRRFLNRSTATESMRVRNTASF